MRRALPAIAACLLSSSGLAQQTSAPDPDAPPAIQASLERMRQATEQLHDATYTLHKREWMEGDAFPPQTIAVKLRSPDDLYLRWTSQAYPGREVLRREGWNEGQLRVSPGSYLPTVDLDPSGSLAMRGSRQPAQMGSITRTAQQILRGADQLSGSRELDASYQDLGRVDVQGLPSHCYVADLPVSQDPGQYAHRVKVCMSLDHGLPTSFMAWERAEGELRLVEHYLFDANCAE